MYFLESQNTTNLLINFILFLHLQAAITNAETTASLNEEQNTMGAENLILSIELARRKKHAVGEKKGLKRRQDNFRQALFA